VALFLSLCDAGWSSAGGFAKEHPADLEEAEKTLRAFAAAEKENRWGMI
jgi:hypothetical protein